MAQNDICFLRLRCFDWVEMGGDWVEMISTHLHPLKYARKFNNLRNFVYYLNFFAFFLLYLTGRVEMGGDVSYI